MDTPIDPIHQSHSNFSLYLIRDINQAICFLLSEAIDLSKRNAYVIKQRNILTEKEKQIFLDPALKAIYFKKRLRLSFKRSKSIRAYDDNFRGVKNCFSLGLVWKCPLQMTVPLENFFGHPDCQQILDDLDKISPLKIVFHRTLETMLSQGDILINEVENLSSLHLKLSLSTSELTDVVEKIFQNHINFSFLEFYPDGIRYLGIAQLSNILQNNKTIKNLTVKNNNIGIIGASFLSRALAKNTTLTHLNLSSSNLSCLSIMTLVSGLQFNKTLLSLNLDHNNIKDEGARFLAENIKYSRIQKIYMHNNSLGLKVIDLINKQHPGIFEF